MEDIEKYVKVMKIVAAYNKRHGTNIEAYECVRWLKHRDNEWITYTSIPEFNCSTTRKFAVGIVEDTPVFIGDIIYNKDNNLSTVVKEPMLPGYLDLTNYSLKPKPLRCITVTFRETSNKGYPMYGQWYSNNGDDFPRRWDSFNKPTHSYTLWEIEKC